MSINMLPYTTKSHKKDTVDQSRYWYDLASAVVHKGKLDAGHYYVYCRQGDQVSEESFIKLSTTFMPVDILLFLFLPTFDLFHGVKKVTKQ